MVKPVGVEHYATAKISEAINAIIDHLGEDKAFIVGQDSGGLHAWHFAMTNPDRTLDSGSGFEPRTR